MIGNPDRQASSLAEFNRPNPVKVKCGIMILAAWHALAGAGAAPITVTDGSPADAVQISLPKSEAGSNGKLSGRLRVSQP